MSKKEPTYEPVCPSCGRLLSMSSYDCSKDGVTWFRTFWCINKKCKIAFKEMRRVVDKDGTV